jgi:hypothetical protein
MPVCMYLTHETAAPLVSPLECYGAGMIVPCNILRILSTVTFDDKGIFKTDALLDCTLI